MNCIPDAAAAPGPGAPSARPSLRRVAGILLACLIVGLACLLPAPEGLTREGMGALGVLLGAVALWFCGSMPQGVAGLVAVAALVVIGAVPDLSQALSGFTSPTTWFILCVFCMTALMQNTSLGLRLTRVLVGWAGADSRRLVLALMVGTAVASFFMTDTGAVVLGMSMSLPLLRAVGAEPGRSNLGRCLMLGTAFAGVLGGFALPCGHSLNILGIGVMEQTVGQTVGFVGWMAVGLPILAVTLPITWLFLIRVFPPEPIAAPDGIAALDLGGCGPWTPRDRKALAVVALLPALWVAGNWIPQLSTTMVAMIGLALLFVPGMDLMSWRAFQDVAGWNVFLFFGSVMCLGNAVSATGGTDFIAQAFLGSGVLGVHPFLVLLVVAFALYLIHTFCPVAPALCLLFLPPLLVWAEAVGLSTVVPVFVVASITAGSFLVPLNPTIAVTYDQGFYRFGEVARGGWLSAVVFVTVTVCWSYLVCQVLGIVQPLPLV